MSYTKQNFKDNEILYAAQLNHIEDGIVNMTPVKGVDYFTEEEIAAILEYATKDIFVAKITYDYSTQKYIMENSGSSIGQAFYNGKTMLCVLPTEYGCILLDTYTTHESNYSFSKYTSTKKYEVTGVLGQETGAEVTPVIEEINNSSIFIVNFTFGMNPGEGSTDKSYYEIKEAFSKGKIILGKCQEQFIPLHSLDENQQKAYFIYTYFTAEECAVTARYVFEVDNNGAGVYAFEGLANTEKRINPNKLKLTGAVTADYDGSKEVSVEIPSSDIFVVNSDPSSDSGLDRTYEEIANARLSGKAVFLSLDIAQMPLIQSSGTQFLFLTDAGNWVIAGILNKDNTFNIFEIPRRFQININPDNTCTIDAPLDIVSLGLWLDISDFYINSLDNIVLSHPFIGEMGELVIQGFNYTTNKKFDMVFYTQEGIIQYYPTNSLGITNASIGQVAKITAVDNGIPTEWESAEIPSVPDWAKEPQKPTYTAEEVGALPDTYEIPVAGDNLGGVKNGGNVVINTNGTMTAPTVELTDEEISTSVSFWLDEHPEATTTVQDGAITRSKMSDVLLAELKLEPNHHLTEVKLTMHRGPYASFWAGTDTGSSSSTELFETPQYIRIVNNHNCDIKQPVIRFADIADYDNATFLKQELGKYHQVGYLQETIPMGEERVFPTYEWGSISRKYMQISYQPSNWNNGWNNIEIYAIYDTWRPTYNIPNDAESKEIFLEDFSMKWTVTSARGTNTAGVYGAVPYYPGFTYHIRGGYYPNTLSNTLAVWGIYDDFDVFDSVKQSVLGQSSIQGQINAFNLTNSYGYTTQYDTSVNGGLNSAYQWAYWQAPAEEEISGLKWILIQFNVGYLSDGSIAPVGTSLTQEQADYILAQWMSKGSQYQYISRWQNKDAPRKPTTHFRFLNPNLDDDGSIYQAFMTMDTTTPMANSKWVLFGDSLTDDYGGHDKTSKYFAAKIASEFAMEFDNRAKSGSNIYSGGSGNYTNVSGIVMLDAYLAEIEAGTTPQADYITVAFGTNTFAAQIGTNNDTSATTTSVYGATKYFIEKIRELVPNAVLGFVLSPRQDWGNADPNHARSVDGGRAAIKAVCDDYGVPYIDMSTQSGITVNMLPDGIHISNDQSQKLYYHAMRRFMMGL